MSAADNLLIIGTTTGVVEITVSEIRIALGKIKSAIKGAVCFIPIKELVWRNNKVYKRIDLILY